MKKTLIGAGGSSNVYRIWKEDICNFSVEKKSIYPLIWEAVWLKKLQGFAVPEFYGIRKEGRYWILSMEYLPGKTLDQLMSENITEEKFFCIVTNIIVELMNIKAQYPNLVFCDLKPSNIMVGRTYDVHLIDFGAVSKAGTNKICRGTRPYAAPEIFKGMPDEKSDIYSVAQIIWQYREWKKDFLFLYMIVPCIKKEVKKRKGDWQWLLKIIRRHRRRLKFIHILKGIWRKIKEICLIFALLFIVVWLLEKNHDIIKFTKAV